MLAMLLAIAITLCASGCVSTGPAPQANSSPTNVYVTVNATGTGGSAQSSATGGDADVTSGSYAQNQNNVSPTQTQEMSQAQKQKIDSTVSGKQQVNPTPKKQPVKNNKDKNVKNKESDPSIPTGGSQVKESEGGYIINNYNNITVIAASGSEAEVKGTKEEQKSNGTSQKIEEVVTGTNSNDTPNDPRLEK